MIASPCDILLEVVEIFIVPTFLQKNGSGLLVLVKPKTMNKLLLCIASACILLLASCGGAPETYTKAYQLYTIQKYDSAMYYFDRTLPEEAEWFDSSQVMKKKCLSAMVKDEFWPMYSMALTTYQNDTALINHGNRALEKKLIKIVDMDSMAMLYRIIDEHKQSLPSNILAKATEYYEDKMLTGYEWESFKGMYGQKLYFVREVVDNYKGENEGNKMQAKSNKTKNGWTKNNVIYRNVCYDSAGIYSMQPRIFQNGYYRTKQWFGKNGSMRLQSKDTLIVNYGGSIRSGNRVWFVRKEKLETKPES